MYKVTMSDKGFYLKLLYTTGIRKSEIINLKWSARQWDSHTMSVTGKGNKTRLIPLVKETQQALTSYQKIQNC